MKNHPGNIVAMMVILNAMHSYNVLIWRKNKASNSYNLTFRQHRFSRHN